MYNISEKNPMCKTNDIQDSKKSFVTPEPAVKIENL